MPMLTLGLVDALWQHEESLLIGKDHIVFFSQFAAINKDFCILFTITSLDVINCNFIWSPHCIQDHELDVKMDTLPLLWVNLGRSVGMVLGLFYTHNKSCAHEILRAFENPSKATLWKN
jgi:hypothetical protein